MNRRFLHGRFVIGVIAVALITPVMVPSPASSAVVAGGADDVIVDLLPPTARQLVAAVTIIKSLSARNRVYREARDVQRDLRAYYDARIDKAKEMAANRTQLGLRESQIAAYMRVATTLRAERDAALQLAEDEKRAAKYTFEGRFRTEFFGALLRTSKGQDALRRVQDTLGDVKGNFEKVQAAIEGQNPIAGFVEDLQKQVDKVRTAGEVLSVISGNAGAALVEQANSVQRVIGNITSATDQAAAASSEAIGTIEEAIGALDGHINVQRTPRAATDILIGHAVEQVAERILTPGGETPTEDVVADVIAAGANPALVNSTAIAVGAIDPSELATMRERIRAQLLEDKLATIAQQCGRLTGTLHTAAIAALSDGTDAPTSTPCTLFRNPEALAEFIREIRQRDNTDATTTTTTAPAEEETTGDRYRVEVSLLPSAISETMALGWVGTFAVEDDVVSGDGEGSGLVEGTCSMGDAGKEPTIEYPISFTATWSIEITGSVDDETISIVMAPYDSSVVAGAGIDESVFCVDISRFVLADVVSATLGDPETGFGSPITVPLNGGTVVLGEDPFMLEVVVTRLD